MLTVQTHLTVAGTSLESEREAKWQTCCTAAQTGAVQQSTNVSPPDNTTTTTNCHSANMLAVLLASVHNTYVSQFTIPCPYIHMACAAKLFNLPTDPSSTNYHIHPALDRVLLQQSIVNACMCSSDLASVPDCTVFQLVLLRYPKPTPKPRFFAKTVRRSRNLGFFPP